MSAMLGDDHVQGWQVHHLPGLDAEGGNPREVFAAVCAIVRRMRNEPIRIVAELRMTSWMLLLATGFASRGFSLGGGAGLVEAVGGGGLVAVVAVGIQAGFEFLDLGLQVRDESGNQGID